MQNHKEMKIVQLLLLMVVLNSCYIQRPDSSSVSSADYNNKREITNPKFVKKRNPIGITIQVVTPIIAGAAMYQYANPIVKYQKGAETKGFQPANAVIGVIGMICINKFLNFSFGYNKSQSISELSASKWMKKTGLSKNYNFVSEDYASKLIIIPKSKEKDYQVYTVTDVYYFKKLFPDASIDNITSVINKAIPKTEQEDLVKLIGFYPDNSACYLAKKKYIETAQDYANLWNRSAYFTDAKVDMEILSSNLVESGDNLSDFLNRFPVSNYRTKVKVQSFKNPYKPYNVKDNLLIRNNVFELSEKDFLTYYNKNKAIPENYFNAKFEADNINSIKKVAFFYTKNQWLNRYVNSNLRLEKAWTIGYNEYDNGDNLVFLIKSFKDYNWNFTEYEVNTFIDSKLESIVKSSVSVSNYDIKRSSNEDLERFRNSQYAPFMVETEGIIHYLIYGDVINTSKFSLPIKVNSSSSVHLVQEGGGATFLKAFASLAMGQNVLDKETFSRAGDVSNSFLIGYIRPHENKKFAIKYELSGSLESGKDFGLPGSLFSVQFVEKVKLDDHKFDVVFSKEYLSNDLINKQNAWLDFVYKDLPSVQMLDKVRGINYSTSQNDRDNEAEIIREANRQAEAARVIQDDANRKNTLVIDSQNAKYTVNAHLDATKSNVINIYTRDFSNYNCCYSATIYRYDINNREVGKVLKKYTNEDRNWFSSANQSVEDNNIRLYQSDFPVLVTINYTHKEKLVSLSVVLNSGSEIEVKPND